jgi:hypothetical protein
VSGSWRTSESSGIHDAFTEARCWAHKIPGKNATPKYTLHTLNVNSYHHLHIGCNTGLCLYSLLFSALLFLTPVTKWIFHVVFGINYCWLDFTWLWSNHDHIWLCLYACYGCAWF